MLPGKEYGEHWVAEIDTGVDIVDTEWHQAGSELRCSRARDRPAQLARGGAPALRAATTHRS